MPYSEKTFKYTRSRFQVDVLAHVDDPNIVTIIKKPWGPIRLNNRSFRRLPNFEIGGGANHTIEILVRYDQEDIDEAIARGGKLCLYYYVKNDNDWTDVAEFDGTKWDLTGPEPGNIIFVEGVKGILVVTATSWPDPPMGWGFS